MSTTHDLDIYLFHRGEHRQIYKFLGSHITEKGVIFRVWAPNAKTVRVIGDFNQWNHNSDFMLKINNEGIWELEIPELKKFSLYKFAIEDFSGNICEKSDPYAIYSQLRPDTASIVYDIPNFNWNDSHWIKNRSNNEGRNSPINIYEVHLGSWQKDKNGNFLNFKDLAHRLATYLKFMNYTHIEILPVSEYPLDDSWGYQITGYFSITSRLGTPEDFQYFVNHMHENGIGVILDWVPGHFCKNSNGLYRFDGTPTYEHPNPLIGENPQWGTCNFDFSRYEVLSFLHSNALYWFREYHIDGIRVDAVANILHLNFSKEDYQSARNEYGGYENIHGISFLKSLNYIIKEEFPNAMTFAEDSTAWPYVTKPTNEGGLGFTYKWNMGWMNDTLKYMEEDPLYRMHIHDKLTFSFMYAYAENYCLPISHDEVVHGKKSLLEKMPDWKIENKFSNLKLYSAYMMAHPGKKLNFMGNEFAQGLEWRFYESLEWQVLKNHFNNDYHKYTKSLNNFYIKNPAFWERDDDFHSFKWVDSIKDQNTLTFVRYSKNKNDFIVCMFNFANQEKSNFKLGVPIFGKYYECFNSHSSLKTNSKIQFSKKGRIGDVEYYIEVDIPPLSALFFKLKSIDFIK